MPEQWHGPFARGAGCGTSFDAFENQDACRYAGEHDAHLLGSFQLSGDIIPCARSEIVHLDREEPSLLCDEFVGTAERDRECQGSDTK